MSSDETLLRITPQNIVNDIYDALECLHTVFTKANVNYTIFGGTMLGAMRHQGLIPWDDDADTAIHECDEKKVADLTDTFAKYNYVLTKNYFGYRIHHIAAKARSDDIFVLEDNGKCYSYKKGLAQEYWPENPLPYGSFQRLRNIKFGHLIVKGLCEMDAREHLKENYGSDWAIVAWRTWDHFAMEYLPFVKVSIKGGAKAAYHSKYLDRTESKIRHPRA